MKIIKKSAQLSDFCGFSSIGIYSEMCFPLRSIFCPNSFIVVRNPLSDGLVKVHCSRTSLSKSRLHLTIALAVPDRETPSAQASTPVV